MPGKTDNKKPATGKTDTKKPATGPQRNVTVKSKQRAAILFKIGIVRSSFVLLFSVGMLFLGIKTGNKCDKVDSETAKFLKYAGIAGICLFGFGIAKSFVIYCYRKGCRSRCTIGYSTLDPNAQMTKRSDMALMSWFDVFSMFPVAAWLAWGSYRVYNDYSRLPCDTPGLPQETCDFCVDIVLRTAQALVGGGWLMFLTTGSMTIHTIYFLNNDSLLFRSLKGNMKV